MFFYHLYLYVKALLTIYMQDMLLLCQTRENLLELVQKMDHIQQNGLGMVYHHLKVHRYIDAV